MSLFDLPFNATENLLPKDGEVNYYGKILTIELASQYLNDLLETIEWQNDEVFLFGKKIVTKRKVAWYGEKEFEYTYSNQTKKAKPWNSVLLELKNTVEKISGENYNSCLLNLYHDGSEGMGWHSDAEKALKKNGSIASISLGQERKFNFKHKATQEKVSILLENGSLLVMKAPTQSHWLHQLPVSKKTNGLRVNLTFRFIDN
jgi:alkylated DNA repair dioxygenase AlkB